MDSKKIKNDIIIMTVILLFGLCLYFYLIPAQIIVNTSWSNDTVCTSQTFPKITACALMIFSIIGIIKNVLSYKKVVKTAETSNQKPKKTYGDFVPLFISILVILYAIMFYNFGYIISTALFIPSVLAVMKCKNFKYYLASYIFAAVMYMIFKYVLYVPIS